MRAVVKTAPGAGHVELRQVPEPTPGAGEVLIAVKAAGICGTDLHIWHDEFPTRPPVTLGHEVAGKVAAVGAGVTRVRPGDAVTSETYFHLCGACRFCRCGRRQRCVSRSTAAAL